MPAFSLADLRQKALAVVDNNTALYTNPEIDYVINECLRVMNLRTGFYRITEHYPGFTEANKLVYDTPEAFIIPSIVYFEGRKLQRLPLRALARVRRNWATDSTATAGPVQYWSPVGTSQFVISPKDATGGRDLTITGLGETPLLVNTSDVIALENEYVEAIQDYCKHRLPLKEGGKVFADGSMALNTFWDKTNERKQYESLKTPKWKLLEPKKEEPA